MIVVCGGIKGGGGKTTIATNLAVMRSLAGRDVLCVDADEQDSASDFALVRNEELSGKAGFTAVKLRGAAVRSEAINMAPKYDDVIIDAGGRDSSGHRAALSVADIYLVPIFPGSFDIWTLEAVSRLIEEASAINERLKAISFLNRADAQGSENEEAAEIVKSTVGLTYLDYPIGFRKAFRKAAASGKAVVEYKPKDKKAVEEIQRLYEAVFGQIWIREER
ncbi:MAG: AAA family ATPase [Chroococcidiopsis sp.]